MSEEKKEPWLNYLALTTVIFAVCATLSTFKGGGHSTKSVIYQEQASNQWSYFQAKNIRAAMYHIQKDNLELEAKAVDKQHPDLYEKYQDAIKAADENMNRYEKEKNEIQTNAKNLEAKRDEAQKHVQPFGIAVIFLQVSILLSSISALFKRKSMWYFALPVGCLGVFYFINGFLTFF
jgi:hypothetical protein